ncbi:MAG: SDR family oxidoreductase [Anaerolineae bacterium]|nr:SDR family oxidoreductase [Anaerolineae bacterium]
MDLGLRGAKVLVTAASQGLGAATARRFSLEGAQVVISSRNLEKLQETAAAINQESGNPVFTLAADVTDEKAVERLVRNSAEMMNGLDILVTNAGGPPAGTFDDFDLETWRSAIELNLVSTINLIKTALPHLRQSKRAAILTITSISAKQPIDNLILSNTTRPGVLGLTKSLSQELGPEGIRVNSILPGTTDTERIKDLMQARAKANDSTIEEETIKSAQSTPLQRIGTPEEFGNTAVFLCSPAAGFITGVALQVDGGAVKATI